MHIKDGRIVELKSNVSNRTHRVGIVRGIMYCFPKEENYKYERETDEYVKNKCKEYGVDLNKEPLPFMCRVPYPECFVNMSREKTRKKSVNSLGHSICTEEGCKFDEGVSTDIESISRRNLCLYNWKSRAGVVYEGYNLPDREDCVALPLEMHGRN